MSGLGKLLQGLAAAVMVTAAAALVAWLTGSVTLVRTLEGRTLDWRFLFRGPTAAGVADIVVILVEEEAGLPYWSPIPREHLAQVISHLGQARLVGLDILLDKPSFDQEGDRHLRDALRAAGNVVAVSYLADGAEHLPDPYFGEALLDHGYATFPVGTDAEVVRQGTLFRDLAGGRALSLAGCLFLRSSGGDVAAIRAGAPLDSLAGLRLIDYAGPAIAVYRREEGLTGGFTMCPSHLVARGVYPEAFFAGKYVFVGSGLMDAPDRFRTPYFAERFGYEKTFGVEIHAHFLRTLLVDSSLRELALWATATLTVGLAFALALVVVLASTGPSVAALAVALAGLWVGGFALFAQKQLVMPLIGPTVALLTSFGCAQVYYALTEGRERRRTRSLFEKYLSPDVIAEFMGQEENWQLGGRRMQISVMFADLEGFTPLSEKLEPEELVRVMNRYLSEMTAIILREGGTIDKYEGDLVMAFFGAPIPQEDHAARACRAAARMQERMAEMREEWRAVGLPELRIRIGVNSGPAVVGNMGSDFRFNYTAMGDTVNLAARLEPANKEFGTYTMVSLATRLQAGSVGFGFQHLGKIQVKGKTEPVEVYELTSARPAEIPDLSHKQTEDN
ncbi:MAG: adenylate/guanylate cyclase domain-containing protein [Gemmatimonadota bacterium]